MLMHEGVMLMHEGVCSTDWLSCPIRLPVASGGCPTIEIFVRKLIFLDTHVIRLHFRQGSSY